MKSRITIFIFAMLLLSATANADFRFLGYSSKFDIDKAYSAVSTSYGEGNDCSVIALAFALNIPYETAHAKLKHLGRADGKGYKFNSVAHWLSELEGGIDFYYGEAEYNRIFDGTADYVSEWAGTGGMTVREFIKKYPVGTYVAQKKGHLFVIKDGAVYDDGRRNMEAVLKVVFKVKEAS